MHIFVTGATGFIGEAVVKELIQSGHQVLGLSRSDAGAQKLKQGGAEALVGTIEDLDILKQGASQCDGVIHLAFIHDFSNYGESCAKDRAAINAMGSALVEAGGNRALVGTSGTMVLGQGDVGDEDTPANESDRMGALRGPSERAVLDFAARGVRAIVVRLPPSTHGPGPSGFMRPMVATAVRQGTAAYIDDGSNRWCAGHRDDAARLYRLAVEKASAGSVFHAVGERSVSVKEITTEIGKQLGVPVTSISKEKAVEHFGPVALMALADNVPAVNTKTKDRLGWVPTGPRLLDDIPIIVGHLKG